MGLGSDKNAKTKEKQLLKIYGSITEHQGMKVHKTLNNRNTGNKSIISNFHFRDQKHHIAQEMLVSFSQSLNKQANSAHSQKH